MVGRQFAEPPKEPLPTFRKIAGSPGSVTGCEKDNNLGIKDDHQLDDGPVAATLEQVHGLFSEAVSEDSTLTLLRGFKVDFSGNPDFHKVYLAVRCHCGTAGLLSVEVAMDKTLPEVEAAMPSLLENLRMKQRMFTAMSCEMHTRMRQGGL